MMSGAMLIGNGVGGVILLADWVKESAITIVILDQVSSLL